MVDENEMMGNEDQTWTLKVEATADAVVIKAADIQPQIEE